MKKIYKGIIPLIFIAMILISININNRKSSSFSLANVEALASGEEDGYASVYFSETTMYDSATNTSLTIKALLCTGLGDLDCTTLNAL